jgi:Sec-independent protein translocase protein TatA
MLVHHVYLGELLPGGGEMLLVFAAVLLFFGPKRLPEIARTIGKAMEYLRRTSQDFREQVMKIEEEIPPIDVSPKDFSVEDQQSQGGTPAEGMEMMEGGDDPYKQEEQKKSVDETMTPADSMAEPPKETVVSAPPAHENVTEITPKTEEKQAETVEGKNDDRAG